MIDLNDTFGRFSIMHLLTLCCALAISIASSKKGLYGTSLEPSIPQEDETITIGVQSRILHKGCVCGAGG